MEIFRVAIEEDGSIKVFDEDNMILPNADEITDYIYSTKEFYKIGEMIMADERFANDNYVIRNIKQIINNYYTEKEALIADNYERLIRLALIDTDEDLESETF